MILRPYQNEILDLMKNSNPGSFLIQLPTGCGKTVIFTNYINMFKNKNVLILSHREELVNQPIKYIKSPVGIEMGNLKSNGENVISACTAGIVRRLDKFTKDYFDVIIIDEAHHAAAKSYKKILKHFNAPLRFGFTATPNRNDQVRLDDVFEKIIYKMDLLTAIKGNYLTNIKCTRSYIDYDLSKVRKNKDDYNIQDLDKAMDDTSEAIAKVYNEKSVGQTLIFGVSVEHCKSIQSEIKDSVLVTADTKNRSQIIDDFTDKKFKCLINCMIFTEGTDLPLIETIIIARPTKNESLYTQMVGRGLRLYKDKTHLNLIDCVGVSNDLSLCTAPSLVGLKYDDSKVKDKLFENEDLLDLPETIARKMDNMNYWKINHKIVDLWAKQNKYNTHNINLYQMPDGTFTLKLPDLSVIKIKNPDELGMSNDRDFQELLDSCYKWLEANHQDKRYLWDMSIIKRWGTAPATDKQLDQVRKYTKEKNVGYLTKLEASQILNRLFNR